MILTKYYNGYIKTYTKNSNNIIYRNLETVNDYKVYNTKHLFYDNSEKNIIPWLYDRRKDLLYIYNNEKYVNSNNENDSFSIIE